MKTTPTPDQFTTNTIEGEPCGSDQQGIALNKEENMEGKLLGEQVHLLRQMLKVLQHIESGASQQPDTNMKEWQDGAGILECFFFQFTLTIWLVGTVVYCATMAAL